MKRFLLTMLLLVTLFTGTTIGQTSEAPDVRFKSKLLRQEWRSFANGDSLLVYSRYFILPSDDRFDPFEVAGVFRTKRGDEQQQAWQTFFPKIDRKINQQYLLMQRNRPGFFKRQWKGVAIVASALAIASYAHWHDGKRFEIKPWHRDGLKTEQGSGYVSKYDKLEHLIGGVFGGIVLDVPTALQLNTLYEWKDGYISHLKYGSLGDGEFSRTDWLVTAGGILIGELFQKQIINRLFRTKDTKPPVQFTVSPNSFRVSLGGAL